MAGGAPDRLFVYGTLRSGEPARPLIEPFVVTSEPATVRGHLHAFVGPGFPGLVISGGDVVVGEIVQLRDLGAVLERLDEYEGEGFSRTLVRASRGDGSSVRAWCYVLADEAAAEQGTLVRGGDWVAWRRGGS